MKKMNDTCTQIYGKEHPPFPEGFIDKPEVARRLGKTVRTIDAWMRRGILPYYKPDRRVLFRWTDIEQHIIAHYRVLRPNRPEQPNLKRPSQKTKGRDGSGTLSE